MEQLRQQNAQEKNLNRILGAEETLLDLENRKQFKKGEEREDNIIKDVKNLFRLKKEVDDKTVKSIRNIFRLKKENKAIKDRIIRHISNIFEQEK